MNMQENLAALSASISAIDWQSGVNGKLRSMFGEVKIGQAFGFNEYGTEYEETLLMIPFSLSALPTVDRLREMGERLVVNFCLGLLEGRPASEFRLLWRVPCEVSVHREPLDQTGWGLLKVYIRAAAVPLDCAGKGFAG